MAHLVRPPPRSSTERRTRHTLSPATDDINKTPITTRHSSRTTAPLSVLSDKPIKHLAQPSAKPAPLARINSRKRPATALIADATPDTRPPTKVTVTQPHGELLRITNGVPKPLGIDQDDVVSGTSTPKPTSNGSEAHLAPAQAPGTQSQDKRSLRSHDGGSRLKSDLATYFSSYDDVIAGVQKPPEFLDIETPIYLVDEPIKGHPPEPASPESIRKSASPARSRKSRANSPPRRPSNALLPASQSSTTFQQLDYSTIAKHLPKDGEQDPMADSWYFAQHRRAERKEKQLRNIEKERAMHEKVQLERLLDGLQGPDWLKVMGITGVTDGERKDWEPKRDYFVKEVEALVDKFRIWKEEEKRLRAEKEAALAAQEDEDEEDEDEESEASESSKATRATPVTEQRPKEPEPPKPRRPPRPHGFLLPYLPVVEPKEPFTSFYSKPHLRAAALGKHRHGGGALAFGLPIPDFEEHEYSLPDDYLDPQFLRDNARKRRRQKRESGTSKNSKSNSQQQPPPPPPPSSSSLQT